jgi:dihydrodipicolinate synthase/N-acetylneuraminate lyase
MHSFRGIIPPLATPLDSAGRLDRTALYRLVDHLLAGGVHGIFALGSTGEAVGLDRATRREILSLVCRQVGGRVPILAGITDASIGECRMLADFAAEAGASALVFAPFFFLPPSQDQFADFLERLIPSLPLPVFLYNIPSLTKVQYEVETVRRASTLPGFLGMKDSSGDMDYFKLVREAIPNAPLLCGPEELLVESMGIGGDGGICGGANLFPSLYVRLYHAVRSQELEMVVALQETVMKISRGVYSVGEGSSSYLRGLKCALACLGLCGDTLSEPLPPLGAEERRRVSACLDSVISDAAIWRDSLHSHA